MSRQSEIDIERRALEFPEAVRLRIAARLLSSVETRTKSTLSDKEALDLAEKRARELDSGEAEGLDYRDAMQRIRQSLNR